MSRRVAVVARSLARGPASVGQGRRGGAGDGRDVFVICVGAGLSPVSEVRPPAKACVGRLSSYLSAFDHDMLLCSDIIICPS
jgi:hypothetical protein